MSVQLYFQLELLGGAQDPPGNFATGGTPSFETFLCI